MTARVSQVAEQLTLDGRTEYVVYYDDGGVHMFKDYPTEQDLHDPARIGWKVSK